jgi:ADP-heptose:LPS heptosyltransferase
MKKNYSNVLVIICGSGGIALGDALIQLPFLRALRAKLPEAKISAYSCLGGIEIMWPLFETFIDVRLTALPERGAIKYDLVFDLATGGSALVQKARSLAPIGSFYSTWKRGWAHLPNLPIYHGKHVVTRHLGLLRQALGKGLPDFWPWPLPEHYYEAAAQTLPNKELYVGIAPGAGDVSGHGKNWPLDRFIKIGELAAERGFIPVIILGPNESGMDQAFRHIPGAIFPLNDFEDVPRDPIFTIALGSRIQIAVSNNGGASHMLALGGCNLLAIFGPTNAIKSVPFAPKSRFIRPIKGKDIQSVVVKAVENTLFHHVNSKTMHAMGCELGSFIWKNPSRHK